MKLSKKPIGDDLDAGVLFRRQEIGDSLLKLLQQLPTNNITRMSFERPNTFVEVYNRIRMQDDFLMKRDLYNRFRLLKKSVRYLRAKLLQLKLRMRRSK